MCSNFVVVEGSANIPAKLKNAVIAIGNFDGVHKGHQYLLQQALILAKQLNVPALVFTFDPHPKTLKSDLNTYHRLITNAQKYDILNKLGFNGIIEQKFDNEFKSLTAENFVENILIKDLTAKAIIVGKDFCFGKGRSGNVKLLQNYTDNFTLNIVDLTTDDNLRNISSSYIRELLLKGQVADIANLLSYHYTVENIVIHGAKLGRKLGFPTVNMELTKDQKLAYGIYAVKVKRLNGKTYNGVASFGKRPTIVEQGKELLETYIFDFDEEIYGEYLKVSFFEFLRPEQKFSNIESLIKQIELDSQMAKKILKQQKPLSNLDKSLCF